MRRSADQKQVAVFPMREGPTEQDIRGIVLADPDSGGAGKPGRRRMDRQQPGNHNPQIAVVALEIGSPGGSELVVGLHCAPVSGKSHAGESRDPAGDLGEPWQA